MIYTFVTTVTPSDWVALPRMFMKGEVVHRFDGHDYGLVQDDLQFCNRETVACCEYTGGKSPFFTVPVEFLRDITGKHPRCKV